MTREIVHDSCALFSPAAQAPTAHHLSLQQAVGVREVFAISDSTAACIDEASASSIIRYSCLPLLAGLLLGPVLAGADETADYRLTDGEWETSWLSDGQAIAPSNVKIAVSDRN